MSSRARSGAAAGRARLAGVVRPLRSRLRPPPAAPPVAEERYDGWLAACAGERLAELDAAWAGGVQGSPAQLRDLDADVWALLLTGQYDAYPNVRRALPRMPEPVLQELWNGRSGVSLAGQGAAFYRRLRERFAQHGPVGLDAATVLDFGCGWGRLTRMLAREVPPERLFGCDPSQGILDVCAENGVPARFALSDPMPDRVPFDEPFDLAYAFSVFTHLSESAHERCLGALHAALRPDGILVVTVRPPEYAAMSGLMGGDAPIDPEQARYVFAPHAADPGHPQYQGGEMTYGEAVVTLPYVRERWSERFALLEVDLLLEDPYQLVLTLRRR